MVNYAQYTENIRVNTVSDWKGIMPKPKKGFFAMFYSRESIQGGEWGTAIIDMYIPYTHNFRECRPTRETRENIHM